MMKLLHKLDDNTSERNGRLLKTRILVFCMSFLCSFVQAQSGKNGSKLYMAMGDLSPKTQAYLSGNNISTVLCLDSRYFAPNNGSMLDLELFEKTIKNRIPDVSSNAIVALDWEGKMLDSLKNANSNSSAFKQSLDAFIKLIQYAKQIRPNVKWGYYSIPFTTYWNRNNAWKSSSDKLQPLLNVCDILFPSFYIFYENKNVKGDNNIAFATDNISQMLKLGKMANKPVMPFVWHRYHVSNSKLGLQLIPVNDFCNYISTILNTSYGSVKAAGVVWWGADKYYFNVRSRPLIDEVEKSGSKQFDDYEDTLIRKYISAIKKRVN